MVYNLPGRPAGVLIIYFWMYAERTASLSPSYADKAESLISGYNNGFIILLREIYYLFYINH